jgi:hypothetical protein
LTVDPKSFPFGFPLLSAFCTPTAVLSL